MATNAITEAKRLRQFLIARCDPTEVFETAKMGFNEITVLILMRIMGQLWVAIGARRNHDLRATSGHILTQRVGI